MLPDDTQATVIKRADEAMYKAKQTGKNRVVSAP
jgi:diguanylate cyclase